MGGIGNARSERIAPISTIHMRLWAQPFPDVVVACGMRRERAKGWGGESISQHAPSQCGRVIHSRESRHRTPRNRGSDKHRHAICPSDVTVSSIATI